MIYGAECWIARKPYVHKMNVSEMKMLKWICDNTRKDKIRNKIVCKRIEIASLRTILKEWQLKWFGYVQHSLRDMPVRRSGYIHAEGNRGRGRPKIT